MGDGDTELWLTPERKSKFGFSVGFSVEKARRDNIEDKIHVSEKNPFWVLADGMGGHLAGEMAAGIVIQQAGRYEDGTLQNSSGMRVDTPLSSETQVEIIKVANEEIYSANRSQRVDSGSTVVALSINQQAEQQMANIAWVGDSPAYVFTENSGLSLVTKPHTWVEEAKISENIAQFVKDQNIGKNVLMRSLGNRKDVTVDTVQIPIKPRDVLLLCSDGLEEGGVTPERVKEVLAKVSKGEMTSQEAATLLTSEAKNGPDNVSVIIVKVEEKSEGGQQQKPGLRWPETPESLVINIGGKKVKVEPFTDEERKGKGYYYNEMSERVIVDLEQKLPEWQGVVKGDEVILEKDEKSLDTGWKLDGFDSKTGEAVVIKKYMGGYMETKRIGKDGLNQLNNPFKTAEEWSQVFITANGNKPEVVQAINTSLWEANVGGKAKLISASEAFDAIGKAGVRIDPSRGSIIQEIFETYKKFEDRSKAATTSAKGLPQQ